MHFRSYPRNFKNGVKVALMLAHVDFSHPNIPSTATHVALFVAVSEFTQWHWAGGKHRRGGCARLGMWSERVATRGCNCYLRLQ